MEPHLRAGEGARFSARVIERVALGRAVREEAERIVASRGRLAEAAAWLRARAPGMNDGERAFHEAVAARVSRMFAFTGIVHRH
jgi:hypothetical protein